LREALKETGADQNEDILTAARRLRDVLATINQKVVASGDHSIATGGSIGDVATQGGHVTKPSFSGTISGSSITTAGGDVTISPEGLAGTGSGLNQSLRDRFTSVLTLVRSLPANPDVDNTEILDKVERIREEITKGQDSNPTKIGRWLGELAQLAPDVRMAIIKIIQDPASGVTPSIRQIAL
jgi:hypothetical protein